MRGYVGFTAAWESRSLDLRYVGNDIGKYKCAAFWMSTEKACGETVMATVTYNVADFLQ